jgi:glucuronate isomerase
MTNLIQELTAGLDAIPLIDPHSHIDPLAPVSKTLDDILGYHYYTELAHSAGMPKSCLAPDYPKRDRCRQIIAAMSRFDNCEQSRWFLDICKSFLGFQGSRVTEKDADTVYDQAEKQFLVGDWEQQVFKKTNLEKVFLTNEFDDPLKGFDTTIYVPCLRTDTLVFHLDKPETKYRLTKATGIEINDFTSVKKAVRKLFEHFVRHNAKACAISLPPDFFPVATAAGTMTPEGIFWLLAEHCREFKLPFDLMIGVNRRVYENGVHQGQDLYDRSGSLIQYRDLFNAFPDVTFPISVLTNGQNQELTSYAWIFPNVVINGHWWYSNIPEFIRRDVTERLQCVPKTKLIGYYSDAYKLEFVLPKYRMYRRILARVLANEFVEPGTMTETEAIALGQRLLRDNVRELFKI